MRLVVAGSAFVASFIAASAMTASAQVPQQSQMGAASAVGQHASAANAKAGNGDEGKPKANDKAYNAALKNLPDKQYDPWRGVR
jgi:hypothetical protein